MLLVINLLASYDELPLDKINPIYVVVPVVFVQPLITYDSNLGIRFQCTKS